MVTDGVDVSYRQADGTIKYTKVKVFDFEQVNNNDWVVANQFTVVENRVDKRPDVVVFVNGIPLVVIELKNASKEEVDISDGYNQLQTYQMTIPSLFTYNSFRAGYNGNRGSQDRRCLAYPR